MSYLFLDTETTGTEDYDQVWNLAYAIDHQPIVNLYIEHTRRPNSWVLKNTDYVQVFSSEKHTPCTIYDAITSIYGDWRKMYREETLYMVCAVPSFDERMIRQSCRDVGYKFYSPWNFRLIDLETTAMLSLGSREPLSLKETGEKLGVLPNPRKHTADGDVEHLRNCWYALMEKFLHDTSDHSI
jgi:hypothetical protein